ncbi:MAG TPA: rhomboid family intramembrane serine protease [Bacillota bacterium]|nr:rhomboid family intramembrane serine protease [Bacillota bacterium]
MKWLDKLERRFGRIAIRGLMTYVVALNGVVFLLNLFDPTGLFINRLTLEPYLVLQGEFWRLITYIFIPPTFSILWIIFTLYFYYLIGNSLEHEWGSFRFNVYYLIGMIGTTIAAFFTGGGGTALFLNLSLFLAFAQIYPDFQVTLFFIIPIKVKYLAWLDWAYLAYTVLVSPLDAKVAALVSVLNFFIFFGKDLFAGFRLQRQSYQNRRRFFNELPRDFTMHKCVICGLTEKKDPKMDFRYCSDCDGDYEYCMNHLKTHQHIKKTEQ